MDRTPLTQITADDLAAYFFEKLGNPRGPTCPACRREEWTHMEDVASASFPAFMASNASGPQLHLFVPLIVLVCRHCAHAMAFVRGSITDWKGEREPE
jgi:hypothetical protein